MEKSSITEIRDRFDKDVERFSNLQTGQQSTIDADISLELLTEAAKRIQSKPGNLLDIGCGAGNYTLKMLSKLPGMICTLIDLSKPMLDRTYERVLKASAKEVKIIQGDIRQRDLQPNHYYIMFAVAVLHHLRDDADWKFVFAKLFGALASGGCLMISDLVTQDTEVLNNYIQEKYGDYLEEIGGAAYKDKVMAYIDKEDSPRSLNYQMDLMKEVGFKNVEILHKNKCFAAFCGIK